MITLAKTSRPLHMMSDHDVNVCVDNYWSVWQRTPSPSYAAYNRTMYELYLGEHLRRVEHSLRTLPV